MDLLMLALLAAAFAGAVGYVYICHGLVRPANTGPGQTP